VIWPADSNKARKIEEGLNPNTVGVMQGVLSTALNQAVDDGLIPSNPASRVKKAVKREQAPMRFLVPVRGLKALTSRCGHARRGPANPRALKTGMRQGELAALGWEDIDLTDKPSITVRRSADTHTRTRISTTKTGKDRRIHIGPAPSMYSKDTALDPPRLEFPERPRPQGILRHYRTPGCPSASLEQNPAYRTAQSFKVTGIRIQ